MRTANDVRDNLQGALGAAYLVEQELGGGGMSRVFVARDAALDRRVVVKLLPPEYGSGAAAEAFRREIQVAARLQHPHIVPILAAGEMRGIPYYTMPFVEGESLRVRLARHSRTSIGEVLRILHDVIDALAYAHARGVVHRDIKPDNVLMSGSHAMITDFGVAKALCAASSCTVDGESGFAIGTPAYMAPEQAAADPHTDHRADLYAFGVLAYELLANRPPFSARSPLGLMVAQVTERPAPIGDLRYDVPQALADIIMGCLEKNPEDRPESAARIREMLEAIAFANASLLIPRRPHSVWQHGSRVAAAVVAFLAGVTGLSFLNGADRAPMSLALAPVTASAPAPFASQSSGAARMAHEVARAHDVSEPGSRGMTRPHTSTSRTSGRTEAPPETPAIPVREIPSAPVAPVAPAAPRADVMPAAPVPRPEGMLRIMVSKHAAAAGSDSLIMAGFDTASVLRDVRQALESARDSLLRKVHLSAVQAITRAVAGAPDDCPDGVKRPAPASPVAEVVRNAQRITVAGEGSLRQLARLRGEANVVPAETQQWAAELLREAERLRAADAAEIERLLH